MAGSSRVLTTNGGSISKTAAFLWSAFRLYYSPKYPTSQNDLGLDNGESPSKFPIHHIGRLASNELNSTATLAITENQPVGTIVGEFNATDPEGGAITYHFVDGDNNNSLFTLDTNGTLKTAIIFDYESNASTYTITVQAKDDLNATTEGNFTVTLLDVYEDTDGDGFGFLGSVNRE